MVEHKTMPDRKTDKNGNLDFSINIERMSDSNGPDSQLKIKENHRVETTKNARTANRSPLLSLNKNEPLDGGHSVEILPGNG